MIKPLYKLYEWAVTYHPTQICLPVELRKISVTGVSDQYQDRVITSPIVSSTGRIVETENSMYELVGDCSDHYRNYCETNGFKLDSDWPVRLYLSDLPVTIGGLN